MNRRSFFAKLTAAIAVAPIVKAIKPKRTYTVIRFKVWGVEVTFPARPKADVQTQDPFITNTRTIIEIGNSESSTNIFQPL